MAEDNVWRLTSFLFSKTPSKMKRTRILMFVKISLANYDETTLFAIMTCIVITHKL